MSAARSTAIAAAGRKPAMKSAAIDRSVRLARITIIRQGGTSTPMAEAAATIDTASSGVYPARVIAGISSEPTAETSAADEPEMPENRYSLTTVVMPRPPRMWPTSARANPTSRSVMPPVFMRSPASTNSGMASRRNESIPAIARCGTTIIGMSPRSST